METLGGMHAPKLGMKGFGAVQHRDQKLQPLRLLGTGSNRQLKYNHDVKFAPPSPNSNPPVRQSRGRGKFTSPNSPEALNFHILNHPEPAATSESAAFGCEVFSDFRPPNADF